MAKQSLLELCKSWGFNEWNDFDNPNFQSLLRKQSENDQQQILMQKKLFWDCYEGNSNPISEGENKEPEDSLEEFQEDTRKKQEQYIKDRGASMVFYTSFINALEDMGDKDFRECIIAITNYGFYKIEADYKGVVKMYMTQAKPQIDANERKRETNRKNGQRGGARKGNDNAKKR